MTHSCCSPSRTPSSCWTPRCPAADGGPPRIVSSSREEGRRRKDGQAHEPAGGPASPSRTHTFTAHHRRDGVLREGQDVRQRLKLVDRWLAAPDVVPRRTQRPGYDGMVRCVPRVDWCLPLLLVVGCIVRANRHVSARMTSRTTLPVTARHDDGTPTVLPVLDTEEPFNTATVSGACALWRKASASRSTRPTTSQPRTPRPAHASWPLLR